MASWYAVLLLRWVFPLWAALAQLPEVCPVCRWRLASAVLLIGLAAFRLPLVCMCSFSYVLICCLSLVLAFVLYRVLRSFRRSFLLFLSLWLSLSLFAFPVPSHPLELRVDGVPYPSCCAVEPPGCLVEFPPQRQRLPRPALLQLGLGLSLVGFPSCLGVAPVVAKVPPS